MSEQVYCPHCNITRDGLADSAPCWNCGNYLTETGEPPVQTQSTKNRRGLKIIVFLLGVIIMTGIIGLGIISFLVDGADTPTGNTDSLADTTRIPTETSTSTPPEPTITPTIPTETPTPRFVVVSATATSSIRIGSDAATFAASRTSIPTITPFAISTATRAPTLTVAVDTTCPGAPPSDLSIGIDALVVNPDGLNIYQQPDTTSPVLTSVSRDQTVRVVDIPICNNGVLWWQVITTFDIRGWIAENEGNLYNLVPVP